MHVEQEKAQRHMQTDGDFGLNVKIENKTSLRKINFSRREKGSDLTQSCDKSPYTGRKIQRATWQHKNATKNFDYTTIVDRLRTVSWG